VAVRAGIDDVQALESQRDFVCNVGRVSQLAVGAQLDKPEASISVVDGGLEIFVVVGGLVDLAGEAKRLEKELAKADKQLAGVVRTLENPGFVAKATAAVIAKKREQREELERTIAQLRDQLADFS
jgi:valyl-tRNA synthetase